MPPPDISPQEAQAAVPEAKNFQLIGKGGQKIVFSCSIEGTDYALKFMRPDPTPLVGQSVSISHEQVDEITARARREVETMRQCNSPYLVKMGRIGLESRKVGGEDILLFSEELIAGSDLWKHLNTAGTLTVPEAVRLAVHVTEAIRELWSHDKIHRDIKPGNIMMRESNGDFVLLDMGLVFDLGGESLSLGPMGTITYFSPEHLDFDNRRQIMDCRSDFFSLGIVLYEMLTGCHPFRTDDVRNSWEVMHNIRNFHPVPLTDRNASIPRELNSVVMRLLAKHPNLRYRSPSKLVTALSRIPLAGG